MRLAVVPAFFGLGVLWAEDAPWPRPPPGPRSLGSSPMLARLEEVRVAQVVIPTGG